MQKEYTLSQYSEIINDALMSQLESLAGDRDAVCEAMKYSASAGGKRIRPVLTLEFCRICGGDVKSALPFACAVEMIHTYSLIHDDMPCMDDDDMRRGRPSCHKKFGEAYALLAGDGLLTAAFECIAKSDIAKNEPMKAVEAISVLASCAGVKGMIGGQTLDLMYEKVPADEGAVKHTDKLKTGKLICAAALMGCIAAGADESTKTAAEIYCENLGLAFQVVDDLLDVEGDEKTLGKPVGSDAQSGKSTYVALLGLDSAKTLAAELTSKAAGALDGFNEDGHFLRELAASLLRRKS